jgi:type I restriction enzyme S subunit
MDIDKLVLPFNWQVKTIQDVYRFTKKPKGLRVEDQEIVPFIPMDLLPVGHVYAEDSNPKCAKELGSGTYFENGDLLVAKITPSFENGKQAIAKIDSP